MQLVPPEFAIVATPYQIAVVANSLPEDMPEHAELHGFAETLAEILNLPTAKASDDSAS